MALPVGLDTVTVAVGPFVAADGNAASGTVTFTPSSRLLWTASGATVLEGPVSVSLGPVGTASVELPATDADGLNVSGFYYTVTYNLTANGTGMSVKPRAVQLPAAAPNVTLSLLVPAETGATVDVDLPTVVSVAGLSGAVDVNDLGDALEDAGYGVGGSGTVADGSITTAKLADNAVTTSKIAAGAVGTTDLADASVTVAKVSATGTPSSSTYLRGDGAWATPAGGVGGSTVTLDADGTLTVDATTVELATDAQLTALSDATTTALAGKASTSHAHSAGDVTSGTLPLARGGTGGTDASSARTSLGLGDSATKNVGTTSTTVAAGDAPAAAAAGATLAEAFGTQAGTVISPATPSATIGPELWALANFVAGAGRNTTQLAPTLTANGTTNNYVTTFVNLGNLANRDTTFRLAFDFDITVSTGWAGLSIALVDTGGSLISGTVRQYVATVSSFVKTGRHVVDFKPDQAGLGTTYLELRLESQNNAPSGTVSVSNVTLKATGAVSRPMLVAKQYQDNSFPNVYWQQQDVKSGAWKTCVQSFGPDGALGNAFAGAGGFAVENPFVQQLPDPAFARASAINNNVGSSEQTTGTSYSLSIGNRDHVFSVWNGSAYELRGNVHNGETLRSAATWKIDQGSGLVDWPLARRLVPVRRFQAVIPTQLQTTTGGSPFANSDHTFTCFQDGMIRCDRTTTFLSDTQLGDYFEWMCSHSTTTPYLGRIGRGLTVLGEVDTHNKASAPALTPSTSGTGGTLAAATYSYVITALTPYGESTPSAAVTQATTGTTSTVTLAWSAATNATGYRIYGRTGGVERLLVTLGAVTTWTDDGSLAAGTAAPPTVNTARYYSGTNALDSESSSEASWTVFREPRSGWCIASIYDRDSVLTRPNVSGLRARIEMASGIHKMYTNVYWSTGVSGAGATPSGVTTVTTGTVWTATHWAFMYLPYDETDYHAEAAVRAANLSALKSLYPAA